MSIRRVFLAHSPLTERISSHILLTDMMNLEIVGEATDWSSTLALVPTRRAELVLVDWDILPGTSADALKELRKACPTGVVIVLVSPLDTRQQSALEPYVDAFITKGELSNRVIVRMHFAASLTPN